MRALFINFLTIGFLSVSISAPVVASSSNVADQIKAHNQAFETILNTSSDPEVLISFLDEAVSNDVEIRLEINNLDKKGVGDATLTLSKADYINSYLYGPRQVRDYHAEIKTLDVSVNAETNTATSEEILTESGITKNPHDYKDKGKKFTSKTVCQSEYNLGATDKPVLKSSTCHTQIAYMTDV